MIALFCSDNREKNHFTGNFHIGDLLWIMASWESLSQFTHTTAAFSCTILVSLCCSEISSYPLSFGVQERLQKICTGCTIGTKIWFAKYHPYSIIFPPCSCASAAIPSPKILLPGSFFLIPPKCNQYIFITIYWYVYYSLKINGEKFPLSMFGEGQHQYHCSISQVAAIPQLQ